MVVEQRPRVRNEPATERVETRRHDRRRRLTGLRRRSLALAAQPPPAARPPRPTSHSCAGATTAPRPSPPGPTRHPNPASTTGPAPPAPTSASPAADATAGRPSPPRSTRSHPTASPEHPAPPPRCYQRGHRHVHTPQDTSLRQGRAHWRTAQPHDHEAHTSGTDRTRAWSADTWSAGRADREGTRDQACSDIGP